MKSISLCVFLLAAALSPSVPGYRRQTQASPVYDMGDWGADCPDAPFAAVRYLLREMAAHPHQGRFTLRWDCLVAGHDDQVSCVYDRRHAALTATYTEGFTNDAPIVSRLYHVTRAVLSAAARQPLMADGRGLELSAPFAALLPYGARRKP